MIKFIYHAIKRGSTKKHGTKEINLDFQILEEKINGLFAIFR